MCTRIHYLFCQTFCWSYSNWIKNCLICTRFIKWCETPYVYQGRFYGSLKSALVSQALWKAQIPLISLCLVCTSWKISLINELRPRNSSQKRNENPFPGKSQFLMFLANEVTFLQVRLWQCGIHALTYYLLLCARIFSR